MNMLFNNLHEMEGQIRYGVSMIYEDYDGIMLEAPRDIWMHLLQEIKDEENQFNQD